MNLGHGTSRLAGRLFALAVSVSAIAIANGAEGNRLSEAGMPILDTPEAWRTFVSGPVMAFAHGVDHILFVGSNRLASFDGFSWHNIDAPGVYGIRALTPARDGRRIWLGAAGSVGYVERNSLGQWNYFSLNAQFARGGIANFGEIRDAHVAGESVIFVGRDKVMRWTPTAPAGPGEAGVAQPAGRVEVWELPGPVRLYPFSEGESLMFYQTGGGLWRMEAAGPKLWLPEDSLPALPPMVGYVAMPNGNKFAVFTDGIFRHDGERWTRMKEASDTLGGRRAIRAVGMAEGLMAVGTYFGGIVLVRADGSVQDVLTVQSGLADNNIDKLWADENGQLWIGMWTGFARLSGVGVASLYDQRLGYGTGGVLKVFRREDRLTAITSQGIYTLKLSKNFEPAIFTRTDGHFLRIRDAVGLDDRLWLASADGLWQVSDAAPIPEPAVLSDVFFVKTLRALPHALLLLENRRITLWQQGGLGWSVQDLGVPLDSTPVSTFEDDAGRLWVSTLGGHVECFEWDNGARLLRPLANFAPGSGLPAAAARPVLSQLDGRIYAFTENDVLRLDRVSRTFESVREFGDFTVVAGDHTGGNSAYWVVRRKTFGATGLPALMRVEPATAGLDALRLTPLVAPGLDKIGEILSVDRIGRDRKEELWIGGERALLRLDPMRLRQADQVPAVTLQSVRVNASRLANIGGRAQAIFDPTVSRLEFDFAAGTSTNNPQAYFYETKLAGVETDWSAPQSVPRREFTGLAAGEYVFAARAVNRIGQPGESLRYPFLVEAPWYRRPWALAIWMVGAGLFVAGTVRWRLRQLKRHAAKLNELVDVRTRELSLSNSAKSEFLENISHEIRNPLNGIAGLIHLLDETGLSERQREHARALKECSRDLNRVFHEVLDFSKLEYGYVLLEERAFSMKEMLESVRALFHAAAIDQNSPLTLHFSADFTDGFWGDESKLKSIVTNFVSNALKYAPGTAIEIAVTSLGSGDGFVEVLLEVTDRGPGVPAEEQELIFKKFVRGSHALRSEVPGTGIGLATCRAMARLMGGSVGVESAVGNGSTFFVKVPLRRESITLPATGPVVAAASASIHAALVVEDQHYNQVVLAGMMAKLGFVSTCVFDGSEALAAIERKAFEVVFLDVELLRMKGPEIARRARRLFGGSRPLIMGVSANDSRQTAVRCLAAGMDAFLVKPFTLDSLLAALAEARARRESGGNVALSVPDFTALELYAKNTPGGFAGAVESFTQILRNEIAALQQAIESGRPPDEVVRAAHRVRSHAQIVGASAVIAAAAKLETAARAGNVTHAADQLAQIQRAASEIEQVLSETA